MEKGEKDGKYEFWLGNYCMEQGDGGVGVDFFGFLSLGNCSPVLHLWLGDDGWYQHLVGQAEKIWS